MRISGLPEYDDFFGRVVEKVYYDTNQRCYVRNYVREPKKPSDTMTVDPDAQLQPERLPEVQRVSLLTKRAAVISRQLREKPMTAEEMIAILELSYEQGHAMLRYHSEKIVKIGKARVWAEDTPKGGRWVNRALYGLAGVDYAEREQAG